MVVKQALSGMKCFDVNEQLFPNEALAFKNAGYDACARYIPRTSELITGNLSAIEMEAILDAGLALWVVQHCPLPNWSPSAALGQQYGAYAVKYLTQIGMPKLVSTFLDLETPSPAATAQECIDYANAWYAEVLSGGYSPGVYVGYGLPLSSAQLYGDLKFKSYWRAYNGPEVATRGFQIVQSTAKTFDGINFDPDIIQSDLLLDLPMLLYPS